jgi:hypothetical protein
MVRAKPFSVPTKVPSHHVSAYPDDPLTLALAPPPDETRKQRAERARREREARVISNNIDEDIKKEDLALRKQNIIRVLLLGQSESGKSRLLPAYHTYAYLLSGKSTTFRSTTSFVTKSNK